MITWLNRFVESALQDGWKKSEIQTFLSLKGYNRKIIAENTGSESSNVSINITNFTDQKFNILNYDFLRFQTQSDFED